MRKVSFLVKSAGLKYYYFEELSSVKIFKTIFLCKLKGIFQFNIRKIISNIKGTFFMDVGFGTNDYMGVVDAVFVENLEPESEPRILRAKWWRVLLDEMRRKARKVLIIEVKKALHYTPGQGFCGLNICAIQNIMGYQISEENYEQTEIILEENKVVKLKDLLPEPWQKKINSNKNEK